MGSQTAKFAIPYPTGTDRVADGDNAMQAIAEKVDAIIGTPRPVFMSKGAGTPFFKSTTWFPVDANKVTLTLSAAALVFVKCSTDIQGMTGAGSVSQRIGNVDDTSKTTWFESGTVSRFLLVSTAFLYLPSGATVLTPYVQNFVNTANGYTVNASDWAVFAFGGTPSLA